MSPEIVPLLALDFTAGGLKLNSEQRKWLLVEIKKRRKNTTHTLSPLIDSVPSAGENEAEGPDNDRSSIITHPDGQQLLLRDDNGTRVLLAVLTALVRDIVEAIAHRRGITQETFSLNFFLKYSSKNLDDDQPLSSYKITTGSTIDLRVRTRGGAPKAPPPPQPNSLKVFTETSKKHTAETELRKKEQEDYVSGKEEAMQARSMDARKTLLLQEGAQAELSRLRRLDRDETRQIQEKAIREEVEVILLSKDKLSQEEEISFAQGVNKTVDKLKTRRGGPTEHKQKGFVQWVMTQNLHRDLTGDAFTKSMSSTRLMQAGARGSVSAILRSRSENHTGAANDQGCPTNESIREHFQDLASKVTVFALPIDHQDKTRTQSTDFQIIFVDAKHQLTEWVQRDSITIQGWHFDLVVEPPLSSRLLLTPTNQDDNRAKLLTLIECIKSSHTKSNIDTRFENIVHQGIIQSWNTSLRQHGPNLLGVRLEHSRMITAKGGTNNRVKPSLMLLGERGPQPPPQIFLHVGPCRAQEQIDRIIQDILSAKVTIKMNIISDTDKTTDNFITFSLNPLSKRPATGQEGAIERARYHLQEENRQRTEYIQKLTTMVTAMEHDRADHTPEEGRTITLSMSNDLMAPGRSYTSQRLGQSIVDTLGDAADPTISTLDDISEWQELNNPANYVMTRVTGINNLKAFFVAEKFKNANSSRKDRDATQMHLLKVAMQTRGARVEVLERIFDEWKPGQPQDAFLAIFTEDSWQHLQGSMVQIMGSINWRMKGEAGFFTRSFDNKQQLIPDLVLRPLADVLLEEGEEDQCIIETLKSGMIVYAPRNNKSNVRISRLTLFTDIPDIPDCKSISITKIPGIRQPDSALKTLYSLLEKDQVRQIEGPQSTTLWIYAPFLDAILILDDKILKELRPTNSEEVNRALIMDSLYQNITKAILQNAAQGLWMEDTPFQNTTKGTGTLDEGKDHFPTKDPVSMPMAIIPMLKLSPKIDQGLSTITCKVLSDLVDASLLEPIEKQGHTLLLKKDSDLKQFLLQSHDLRVGFPFSSTLPIPQEDITKAFDQMLSTHFGDRGWGIVFLSTSEEVDYPDIETNDYKPLLYSNDPLHICNAGSQILAQGTWLTQSQGLRAHKKAKSILQYQLQNPKGLLWLCTGKQNTVSGTELRTMDHLFGPGHGICDAFFNGGAFQTTQEIWVELQTLRNTAILVAARKAVAQVPAIIPNRVFETNAGRPTTTDMPLKGSSTIHQGWLLLPLQQIDTNPTELLQTVLSSKDTETTMPNGVVAIPVEDMGILLARSTQFEKVSLGTVWKDLLRALTLPPTANNLKFLEEEESEEFVMEFVHDYNGSEAGVNARLPPSK